MRARSRQFGITGKVLTAAALSACLLFPLPSCPRVHASGPPPTREKAPDAEIVLVLNLDGETISDNFLAVERAGRIFIPICAAAEALSLAVTCEEDRAFGFILRQSRPFAVDLTEGHAVSGRNVYRVHGSAFLHGSELVADLADLSTWWPVDFEYQPESSTVRMHARELLPIQELKKRMKFKGGGEAAVAAPKQYQDFTPARKAATIPAVDLTSQLTWSRDDHGGEKSSVLNAINLAGDLLYLSAEAHLWAEDKDLKRFDLALGRRSEAGFKVGPVPMTQLLVGTSQAPNLDGIGSLSGSLYGIFLSNRPLSGSAKFLTHDMDGYLPAGWDAELFHNGSLIGYQPPTQDGRYHFHNLRTQYGINYFKVVTHGPYGETRETEETFYCDAVTPTGEFLYSLSAAWETGLSRTQTAGNNLATNFTFTGDFGLLPGLAGSLLGVRQVDEWGKEQDFTGIGVRTSYGYTLISLDLVNVFTPATGSNGQLLTFRSSSREVFGVALQLEQRLFREFDSQRFPSQTDPLLSQSRAKLNASLPLWNEMRIPWSLEFGLETKRSGTTDWSTVWRGGGAWRGWNGVVEADVASQLGRLTAGGSLQVSTRVREIAVRGLIGFAVAPRLEASTINVTADKELGRGFVLNAGVAHNPAGDTTDVTAGLTKKFGLIGYSISAAANSTGAYSFNAGLTTSLAADPVYRQAIVSAEPLSSFGMITVSALVPGSAGAAPRQLSGIGFLVNGSRALMVQGSQGVPVIAFLRPDIPVDISVDLSTIEDPFMVPREDGCHIVPRAGVVSACQFTMMAGGEIDGVVSARVNPTEELPIKGVRLELIAKGAPGGTAVASTQTEESGYYVFRGVRPGNYEIVIAQGELDRLKAAPVPPVAAVVPEGGDQLSGKDFLLLPVKGG